MKKFALLPIMAILSLSATADAGSLKDAVKDELTGDTKLACEALLCLSSSERQSECQESLHRYFSIHHKKPHRTIEMRRDFLNRCPATDEDDNMPSLVNAIANGAGKCDWASLNQNAAFQCRSWYDREKQANAVPIATHNCRLIAVRTTTTHTLICKNQNGNVRKWKKSRNL